MDIKKQYAILCNWVEEGKDKRLSFIGVYDILKATSDNDPKLKGFLFFKLNDIANGNYNFKVKLRKKEEDYPDGSLVGHIPNVPVMDNDNAVTIGLKLKEKNCSMGEYSFFLELEEKDSSQKFKPIDLTPLRVE